MSQYQCSIAWDDSRGIVLILLCCSSLRMLSFDAVKSSYQKSGLGPSTKIISAYTHIDLKNGLSLARLGLSLNPIRQTEMAIPLTPLDCSFSFYGFSQSTQHGTKPSKK